MKQLTVILLSLTAAIIFSGLNATSVDSRQQINAVLGDISFVEKFGHQPNLATDENLRIKTHLEYVENLLRQKDISNLTPGLREKRIHLIDLLHNYRMAGIFPRNYDHSGQRIPCFIDKDGRICAVGYLIEQTAGRQVAEYINSKHKYQKIYAMNDNVVDSWIASSGLTKEECAMIQPSYGWDDDDDYNYNHIAPGYGTFSSIMCGMNLSLNAINGVQLAKSSDDIAVPVFGLIAGTSQIILGAVNMPEEQQTVMGGNSTNESQKVLSMVNIGLGTSTVILSLWNLGDKKQTEKQTSWNLYGLPMSGHSVGLGFSVAHRF